MKPTNFVQNKEFDIGLDFDYKEVEDISSDSHIGQNIFKGRFSLKENTSSKSSHKHKINLSTHSYVDLDANILACKFNKSGTSVVSGLSNGYVTVYDTKKEIEKSIFMVGDDCPIPCIRSLKTHKNDRFVAACTSGFAKILDIDTAQVIEKIDLKHQAMSVDVNQDSTEFVIGKENSEVVLCDIATMKVARTYIEGTTSNTGHKNSIMAMCFIDNNTFISAGWDKNFIIWDRRVDHSVDTFRGLRVSGDALDFKHNRLLVGSTQAECGLSLWDIREKAMICPVEWREGQQDSIGIYSCKYSTSGTDCIIAAGIQTPELQVFEKDQAYYPSWTISEIPKGVTDLDINSTGTAIAFSTGNKGLNVLNIGAPM